MDSSLRLAARVEPLHEIRRQIEEHVVAGRGRLARQAQIVALADDEHEDISLARQLLLAMRQTQDSLEGAARQFKTIAAGLVLDSELISRSEFAVVESFATMGGATTSLRR